MPAIAMNLTSSGRLPCRTAAARMVSALRRNSSEVRPPVNTTSACRPANSVPAGEPVAWKITGVRCADGCTMCGPATRCRSPTWLMYRTFSGSVKTCRSRSAITASSSQEPSQSL